MKTQVSSSPSPSIMSRACVFIDANPQIRNQLMATHPFIRPTFPPSINLRDLITKQVSTANPNKNSSGRSPNAFIIYRKLFVETARKDGYQLPMTVVSLMASQSWELEPSAVKAEYKRLAKEANDIRNEIIPKNTRKRKRERWNYVSFSSNSTCDDSSSKSVVIKSKPITKKKKSQVNSKQAELESPKITFDIPYDITSPIIDRYQLPQEENRNLTFFNNSENFESLTSDNDLGVSVCRIRDMHNNEFEYDSPGFSSFSDDFGISYPSLWNEF